MTGERSAANARPYLNGLLQRSCDIVLAVGRPETTAAVQTAPRYRKVGFVLVGAAGGEKAEANVFWGDRQSARRATPRLRVRPGPARPPGWCRSARSPTNSTVGWSCGGARGVRLTGEAVVDTKLIRAADMWVATTEKFEAICRAGSLPWCRDVRAGRPHRCRGARGLGLPAHRRGRAHTGRPGSPPDAPHGPGWATTWAATSSPRPSRTVTALHEAERWWTRPPPCASATARRPPCSWRPRPLRHLGRQKRHARLRPGRRAAGDGVARNVRGDPSLTPVPGRCTRPPAHLACARDECAAPLGELSLVQCLVHPVIVS